MAVTNWLLPRTGHRYRTAHAWVALLIAGHPAAGAFLSLLLEACFRLYAILMYTHTGSYLRFNLGQSPSTKHDTRHGTCHLTLRPVPSCMAHTSSSLVGSGSKSTHADPPMHFRLIARSRPEQTRQQARSPQKLCLQSMCPSQERDVQLASRRTGHEATPVSNHKGWT
jgi:hypothetical protein